MQSVKYVQDQINKQDLSPHAIQISHQAIWELLRL